MKTRSIVTKAANGDKVAWELFRKDATAEELGVVAAFGKDTTIAEEAARLAFEKLPGNFGERENDMGLSGDRPDSVLCEDDKGDGLYEGN